MTNPEHYRIPDNIGGRSFNDIYRRFSDTEYGRTLDANIRFSRFKPDRISNEAWVGLLGADVNNLTHMQLTLGLTRWFINEHNNALFPQGGHFSESEQELLCLAAIIHDQAEAIVGDVPAPDKTALFENDELSVLRGLTAELYGDDPELLSHMHHAIDTVLIDKTTKLGSAFRIIENIGYMRTAMNAWDLHPAQDVDLSDMLRSLAVDVVAGSTPLLRENDRYPAVAKFLELNADRISAVEALR